MAYNVPPNFFSGPPAQPGGFTGPGGEFTQGYSNKPQGGLPAPFGGTNPTLSSIVGANPTWAWQINRNDALAQWQLDNYLSGKLPEGTQAAIDLAYKTGSGALANTFAGMGRTGPDTGRAQGQDLLAQERSISTQDALNQLLQQYMGTSGLEAQLTAGFAQSQLQHEQNQVQLIGEWLQFETGQEQMQQQKDQMMGGLLGSLGSALGGLI